MNQRDFFLTLGNFAKIVGGVAILCLMTWGAAVVGNAPAVALIMLLMLMNLWAVYAFFAHRQNRQDELAQVLSVAVASEVPLDTTVRSYLRDRPDRNGVRNILAGMFGCFLPLYIYIRICTDWERYDQLVKELARMLESGYPLSEALHSVRGVASREVVLAAAIGEATGHYGESLLRTPRARWSAVWLEVAPRIFYPFFICLLVASVTSFIVTWIIPRFKRIFEEFGEAQPEVTKNLIYLSVWIYGYSWTIPLLQISLVVFVSAYIAMPKLRWHTPFLGRLYRWGIQAEILISIGRLLRAGQTVPQSLEFLIKSRVYPKIVRKRIERANAAILRGETLEQALINNQLLPISMGPLIKSAQVSNTLTWALEELGDHLAGRAIKLIRRISMIISPLMILAIGTLVAFLALALFMPLIQIITKLGDL